MWTSGSSSEGPVDKEMVVLGFTVWTRIDSHVNGNSNRWTTIVAKIWAMKALSQQV